MPNMDRKLAAKILIVASVIFGSAIAIMAVLNAPPLGPVAVIGGITLGLLWVLTALFGRTSDRGGSAS